MTGCRRQSPDRERIAALEQQVERLTAQVEALSRALRRTADYLAHHAGEVEQEMGR